MLILYNKENVKSVNNAQLALSSFNKFNNWEPELFNGYNYKGLRKLDEQYNFSDVRSRFKKTHTSYPSKKACFYSHLKMWENCIDLNVPITIMEHDVTCINDAPTNIIFPEGVTQLTSLSVFSSLNINGYNKNIYTFNALSPGIHSVKKFEKHGKWGYTIAGNTGYCITPTAAKTLIDDCHKRGWIQNDLLMENSLVNVYHLKPSILEYHPERELKSSTQGIK